MPAFPELVYTLDFSVDYYASEDGPCTITGDFEGPTAESVSRQFAKYIAQFPVVYSAKTSLSRQSFTEWHDDLWKSVRHGYPREAAMDRVRRVSGLTP